MFDNYLKYIFRIIIKEKKILNNLPVKKTVLQYELDRLLEKIEKNYEILEKEIQIRDFLVQIKEKQFILPSYYINKIKEKKKIEEYGMFFRNI
jgi:hypothetical protein